MASAWEIGVLSKVIGVASGARSVPNLIARLGQGPLHQALAMAVGLPSFSGLDFDDPLDAFALPFTDDHLNMANRDGAVEVAAYIPDGNSGHYIVGFELADTGRQRPPVVEDLTAWSESVDLVHGRP